MVKKVKNNRLLAVIDVGSSSLRLMIAQMENKGNIVPLEDLTKPTDFGRDSFNTGRISAPAINEACEVLKGFVKLMNDYRIKDYRAVATSGLREAENKEYILEQIRLRTGLNVEIINVSQERFMIYKALRHTTPDFLKYQEEGVMIANMSSGGLGVSAYSRGVLRFREYFKVGSLRLWENLSDMEKLTLDFPRVMEEFLESQIYSIQAHIKEYPLQNVIGIGSALPAISRLCAQVHAFEAGSTIKKDALHVLFLKMQKMTVDQMVGEFDLTRTEVENLLPTVIIFNKMLTLTQAEEILIAPVALRHGLLADMGEKFWEIQHKKYFIDDVISSVWYLGQKFGIDIPHCQKVQSLALDIFDGIKKVHKLGERERFYLLVVAILHDIGRYINVNQHHIQSYNIIKSIDIIGFSNRELELMANIARYHSGEIPRPSHENYTHLSEMDKIIVSKLAAMMKLAEAMDISHKQRINKLSIEKAGRDLIFRVETSAEVLLEEWNFKNGAGFFEEVVGYRPVFKRNEKIQIKG
ncbi:HD domain-containing protein [Candidatus Formimonas warabiya]|nr:HD domain-containing protein [Candidatus Formimonas warabiya]